MITAITMAAVDLALMLGVAVAAMLSECARRPTLVPVPARRRIKRR